ncbi:nucleolar protein 14 homolog [Malaya genurostris]|uniref:nucleolar protein 14 homolog n=1 Tax=Malaya genurostris TaxID=325434 RepID=UPI0026F3C9EE|nr:nucleolar protein 14 homolog [Malaya genurostris]
MGKEKRKRVCFEVLLRKQASQIKKKSNPFEIQRTKEKFTILNRETNGRCTGIRGMQRAKAVSSRKQSLGQEFLLKNKNNKFLDLRMHTTNKSSIQPNNLITRKSGLSRRKDLFNLNDSVKLTHKGQTLETTDLDDVVNSDSDSDNGNLNEDFVEEMHFGGSENRKDRKTVVDEMIAESKRRKAEKQRENDEIFEMTQKLDKNWQHLVSVVGGQMKSVNEKPKLEDYDVIMREMIFERRGKPADRLKSEAELIAIEQQKFAKQEQERLARMNGGGIVSKMNHKSADDLDDGQILLSVGDDEEILRNKTDTAEYNNYNPRTVSKEACDAPEYDSEESSSEMNRSNDTSDDNDELSDLKNDTDCEEIDSITYNAQRMNSPETSEPKKLNLVNQNKRQEAIDEMPHSFEIPTRYEHLHELLSKYNPDEQSIIIERMIRFNSNQFSQEKRRMLISLFAFIMQYVNDLFLGKQLNCISTGFQVVEKLIPSLHDLMQLNPSETSQCFLEVLKEKQHEFRKKPRYYPQLDTLVFLKLIPVFFSASDFRHPVVSPALVFASELLSRCQIRTRKDITAGLFVVTTVLECGEQSKRFLPATLNFLSGIIYMCSPKRSIQLTSIVPPFKTSVPWNDLLALDVTKETNNVDYKFQVEDFIVDHIDESFKVRALYSVLGLVKLVCHQLTVSPGVHYICDNFLQKLHSLQDYLLPLELKTKLEQVFEVVKLARSRPLHYLIDVERKPKILRLLEPKIESTYDDIRRRPTTKLTAREQQKNLRLKVKKESRAAVREIRQDNTFIAKMQFKQRANNDRIRLDKVKRIFSDATLQQGELKTLDRKANYK